MRKLVSALSVLTLAGGLTLVGAGAAFANETHTHCVSSTSAAGVTTADCTTTAPDEREHHFRDYRRACATHGLSVVFTCGGILDSTSDDEWRD